MGTSADYGGPKGGDWTPYKVAVSNYARRGGGEDGVRAQRLLSRYVVARGGAQAVAQSVGGQGASRAARGIAVLASGLAGGGLGQALESLGLGALVGKDRYDVIDGLIDALAGDGALREEQPVLSAIIATLAEIFPDDAESFDDLASAPVSADEVSRLVEMFLSWWAYYEMAPTFEAKFANLDPAEYEDRRQELRTLLSNVVSIDLAGGDPLAVDWNDDEGRRIVDRAIAGALTIIEEEYES